MTDLLKRMYNNLTDSLSEQTSRQTRLKNYEKQLAFYDKIFSMQTDRQDREKALVCARCFISISRSLVDGGHDKQSLIEAKDELTHLGGAFSRERGSVTQKIREIAEERINLLSKKMPDEMSDSVLFLYLSLMQL